MLLEKKILKKIIIFQNSKIRDVINNLNESTLKIVLIVNRNKKFIGIINDGDLRRSFLKGFNLNSSIKPIVNTNPFFVKTILDLHNISQKKLSTYFHIPIIKNNKIYGLYIQNIVSSNNKSKKKKEHIVIMAGGYGKRLGSLTRHCPKALLKFDNKPLLQHILEHIKQNNFSNIYLSVFFLKKIIKNFIHNNNFFSLKVNFLEEKIPLGSIGAIRLIKKISNNFIVMNCDVITDVNLNELLEFHKKNKSLLTISTKSYKYTNPYGVIVSRNNKFVSFSEKPEMNFEINAGIYVFNKKIINIMNKLDIKNIEDLVKTLVKKKYKVLTYPIFENWRDFGNDKNNLKN